MPLRATGRPLPANAEPGEGGGRDAAGRVHRTGRRATGALLAGMLGVGGLVAVGPTAQAAESYPVPATGSITLAGHGFGHGHGLSQWGAYGAAEKGLTWQQILAFYYPGTRISAPTLPDSTLRILMTADDTTDTRVDPAAGLALDAAAGTVPLPTGAAYAGWRLVTAPQDRTQLQLQHLTGAGGWVVWNPTTKADDPAAVVGGDAAFEVVGAGATTGVDALPRLVLPSGTRRAVRGEIRSVAWAGGGTRTIALVPMEQYLRSVVPAEMPASWPPAALAAQAVAARTYAGRSRAVAGSSPYDVCDSTACQVYAGSADYSASGTRTALRELSASDAAVRATAGQVVRYGSGTSDAATLAFTQFSSSNGGWSTAGSQPYLVAKADPYDGVPSESWNPHDWSATLSGSRLAAAYPSVGTVTGLEVLSRDQNGDWGGRVTSVRVTGSSGSVTVTGSSFQAALGLRSTWWTVTSGGSAPTPPPPGTVDFSGDGRPDLLVRDPAGQLWLYPGTADGSLGVRTLVGRSGWSAMSALTGVGDLSGDGRPDLLARDDAGRLWLYPGTADGSLGARTLVGRSGWSAMDALTGVGDLSGDGRPDLLARDAAGRLWLYPGTAGGSLGARTMVGRSGWSAMDALTGVGDLSGDRRPDLLARDGAGALWLYPGTADGSLGARRLVGRSGWSVMTALVGTPPA